MGPRLASLALLLLALCRQSSAGPQIQIQSFTGKSSTSSNSITMIPATQRDNIQKNIGKTSKDSTEKAPTEAQLTELVTKLGNSLIDIALSLSGDKDIPKFLDNALDNGLMCEAKVATNEELIVRLMYPRGVKAVHDTEKAQMKATILPIMKIDCDAQQTPPTAPEKCLCVDMKAGFWCLLQQISHHLVKKGRTITPCREEALEALKKAGSGALGKEYDVNDKIDKNPGFDELFKGKGDPIETLTKKLDDAMTNLFCDALDINVEKAVKDLYAADATYWLAESFLYALLFGPSQRSLEDACKDSSFTSHEYGKCVCNKGDPNTGPATGFTFCIYKVLAEFFQKEKFLDCGAKTFDKAKKPLVSALPQFKGPPKATSSASLLLAPASVAAAMLLLRH